MRHQSTAGITLIFCFFLTTCTPYLGDYDYDSVGQDFVELGTGTISTSNRIITISDASSIFNGMEISVTENYSGTSVNFIIESGDLPEQTFSEYFNPFSEMLRISNGGGFSEDAFFIKIPIEISSDEIPVAFAYNETTGLLEPLSIVFYDNSQLIFAARHFTQSTLSSDLKSGESEALKDYANILISVNNWAVIENKNLILTDFFPGVDDWEFANCRTVAEPEGNCAGHCLSALFYYNYKTWANQVGLYKLYDRDHDSKIWQDNPLGLRLVSEVQKDCNKVGKQKIWDDYFVISPQGIEEDFLNDYHKMAYKTAAVQLLISNQPIYTEIYQKVGVMGSHAVIITGINLADNTMHIADPNYPGITRTASLQADGYLDYYSSVRTDAPRVHYERFLCMGFSAMNNWKAVADYWRELEKGTIGDQRFPTCEYLVTFNQGTPEETTNTMGEVNKIWLGGLSVSTDHSSIRLSCDVNRLDGASVKSRLGICENSKWIANSLYGKNYVDLDLESLNLHNSTIGIYVIEDILDSNGYIINTNWIDFKWLNISEITLNPVDQSGNINEELSWEVILGNPPTNTRFEWTFGDGLESLIKKNSNTASHTYKENGIFPIMVIAYDDDTNECRGVAVGLARIQEGLDINYITIEFGAPDNRNLVFYSNDYASTGWTLGWSIWMIEELNFTVTESSVSDGNLKIVAERKASMHEGKSNFINTLTMEGQYTIGSFNRLTFSKLKVSETRSYNNDFRSYSETKQIELTNVELAQTRYNEKQPMQYELYIHNSEDARALITDISHVVTSTNVSSETEQYYLTHIDWESMKGLYFDFSVEIYR